jgi:RNA polymerase sigma-70 factor (ECF subfamily)
MLMVAEKERMSDRELCDAELDMTRRAAAGDAQAQRQLVLRVLKRVQHTCGFLAGDGSGEDLAQMALVQVVRSAGGFRAESSLEYWVDRVTVRTAAKVFEKKSRRKRIRDSVSQPVPESVDIEHQAALGEVRERLCHHFSLITEKQRVVVVLHYLHDYEIPEIADLMSLNINAVRSRLRKGLKRLRSNILKDPSLREWIREGRR